MHKGLYAFVASISFSVSANQLPLNSQEWSNAAKILLGTKTILEENEWYRAEKPSGKAYCLSEALEKSWKDSNYSLVDLDYAKQALNKSIDAPKSLPTSIDDPLSVPYWGRYYMYWNDADHRTKKQVIDALERAISFAQFEQETSLSLKFVGENLADYDLKMMRNLGFTQ